MLFEKSCGALVYRKFHGNIELLLIKHANGGHWSFPKGHVEEGETETETAQREIYEETGVEVIIDPTFREIVSYSPITPQEEEISAARWVELSLVHSMLTYDNDKQLVNKARPIILRDSF